jgi:hypothetical protein
MRVEWACSDTGRGACYAASVAKAILRCTCTRTSCKAERPTRVVREDEGAKPFRLSVSDGDEHRYIVEASSPCPECGCKTVRLVYDMGVMLE